MAVWIVAITVFLKVARAEKKVAIEPAAMIGTASLRRSCHGKTMWKPPENGRYATAVAAPTTKVVALAMPPSQRVRSYIALQMEQLQSPHGAVRKIGFQNRHIA